MNFFKYITVKNLLTTLISVTFSTFKYLLSMGIFNCNFLDLSILSFIYAISFVLIEYTSDNLKPYYFSKYISNYLRLNKLDLSTYLNHNKISILSMDSNSSNQDK
jgi:hypothetical protein